MSANPRVAGLKPVHPGEILREDILPALGRDKTEIARLIRISRRMLYDLLETKKPVTAQMALRIGKLTGSDAAFWLQLQTNYDLALARAATAAELKEIPTLHTPELEASMPAEAVAAARPVPKRRGK